MSILLSTRLELGEITDGDGEPFFDESIVFFEGLHDSPEIRINAPDAAKIAARIVELWNAALSPSDRSNADVGSDK